MTEESSGKVVFIFDEAAFFAFAITQRSSAWQVDPLTENFAGE
jgi:hypothetical protein